MNTAKVLDQSEGKSWAAYNADCVDVVRGMPESSIHYSIFSPPFASLYTYSSSDRDMGNVKDGEEFARHFAFLIPELLRVTMPGRLLSMHCMNLPTSKARDGVIGLTDFRGELIRAFVAEGWIYHSEVCIWKDPVTAMQRTKALGLLHKQIKKDSCMSRQGIADYLVTFRKPGDNPERVTHTDESFPVAVWQRYASPVWMDVDPSRTLQYQSAREHADERHVCPLQLDVIERAINLWTNPGDVVLSPFMGIGSEGWCAVRMGRRFVGAELKRSYYEQACRNLATATPEASLAHLFAVVAPKPEEPTECPKCAATQEELDSAKSLLADSEYALDAVRSKLTETETDLEKTQCSEQEALDRLQKIEDAEPNTFKVAAAFHDLMRDERMVTDAERDVPLGAVGSAWRNKLEKTAEDALS